jgi:tRNA (guanine37-N1)-methyltransferase
MSEQGTGDSIGTHVIRIVTLFPDLFRSWLGQGVVSRAVERGVAAVRLVNLREFGLGRHKVTDDYPFGGGAGMVMKPEPIFAAVESLDLDERVPVVLLSPRGRVFSQRVAEDLAQIPELVLLAGHYEGIDERVREHLITDELSVGDFVLSAGELAAMVVTDAVVRLLPGALAEDATSEESFQGGMLEYPQYTRPAVFREWAVPEVLLSGHHAQIAAWRRRQALLTTLERRPDLLCESQLSQEERRWLAEVRGEGPADPTDA